MGAVGLYESEGTFEGRDAANQPTGEFSVSSFAAGGARGLPVRGHRRAWRGRQVGEPEPRVPSRGAGMTWDAGMQVHAGMFGFGLAAQNAFGKMRFGSQSFDFPTNYGVGMAVNHAESGVRFALDANFPNAYYSDVRTGVDWRWRDLVALRGGYRSVLGAPANEALSGPTFGFGAGAYGMWFDYGFVIPGSGDGQHRIGLSLRPSRMNTGGGAVGDVRPADPARVGIDAGRR